MRVHTARRPWCLMKGSDRKALDPFCISFPLHPHSRSFVPSVIGISQHRLSALPVFLASPLIHSLHHRPKNVRHSSTQQFPRLQSCVSFPSCPPVVFSHFPTSNQGPLTQNVKRSLNITNPNADPVSFKIKTTAPKVCSPRVQIDLGLPVSQAVLRTAQLWQGRPRTNR